MAVIVHRSERLVQLDVGAVWQALDDAGLDAVLQHVAVAALQADSPSVGDEVDDRRQNHHADAADPRGRVQRNVELQREDVVHGAERQQHVERDGHRADRRANRHVARPLQQVVVGVVAGELPFQERVAISSPTPDPSPVRPRMRPEWWWPM